MNITAAQVLENHTGSSGSGLKILTLTCTFPNVVQPGLGTFVRSRVQSMAEQAEVKVIAPVSLNPVTKWGRKWFPRGVPRRTVESRIEVLHPRYLCPPGGTFLNPFLLAARLIWPVARLRRRFRFQLLDSHFGYPDGIVAALLGGMLGVPFTVTLRGNEVVHAHGFFKQRLLAWALRRAACVISVSERLRQFAITMGANPDRVRTIPNGINVELFYPRDRAECRRKWKLPMDRKIILSAGHLIELKGHHRVARALKALQANGTLVDLVVAGGTGGEDSFEAELRRMIADLGIEDRVRFLGHVENTQMPELMSAVDLLCLASTREGWPNVVHEALGCGAPAVATDVGGIPDLLPSERYGLIVPVGNQAALEDALARALKMPWDHAAISIWGQSRSWNNVAREVLAEMAKTIEPNLSSERNVVQAS